ncbi:AAA family ATPase [Caballeronia sp. LZ062]|uniref:ATP-binding protein n=1 Tax=unclassified Caballeronia TaxID=2646786 RepID=UPI002859B4F3|nr:MULTISPECIES: AAA family ATPase [unclassified Caballeronia]MDR5855364.1 AAA family ATPase [Caballeronia sp. LZ050]MDR5870108.1 AAA family ATPase [Caballeronia sp. LZ062]
MRIRQLDLIRFGKFTDHAVEFPLAEHDFHFVVGPNEAGKSTIKTAISELLFGMPHSSSLAFLHAQSDLRLGAKLEKDGAALAFHRTKSRKAPLTTPNGDPLAADALAPFLGAADKSFFEQMYCLDHTALIRGGQSILDASSDVGQVLFQSAAGIASLGDVRQRLADEAGSLWAKRKLGTAYAVAHKQYEEATAELKAASVRTAQWRRAHGAVEEAEERSREQEARRAQLETVRAKLERIRRAAPYLNVWRAKSAELDALGDTADLPANAEATLQNALKELTSAQTALDLHTRDVAQLQKDLSEIRVDQALLAVESDIRALEATRHRCANHANEIARLEQEVAVRVRQIAQDCAQLGWPQDEASARQALPGPLVLQTVSSLMLDRGELELAARNAERAAQESVEEIAALETRLASLSHCDVAPGLRAALRAAQKSRDTETTQRRLDDARRDAEHALETALASLGKWTRPVPELRAMTLPAAERIAALRDERQALGSRVAVAGDRLKEAQDALHATQTELGDFVQTHDVVTAADVREARDARNAAWHAIRAGDTPLAAAAPHFETAMHTADGLADRQLGSVGQATQLIALKRRVAAEQETAARREQAARDAAAALDQFDAAWRALAEQSEIADMALDDVPSWLARRDQALAASHTLDRHIEELARETADAQSRRAELARQLAQAGVPADAHADLDALCDIAESHISAIDEAAVTRRHLSEQLDAARAERIACQRVEKAARDAFEHWQREWSAAAGRAGLAIAADSQAAAETAIGIVKKIGDQLAQTDAIRSQQIEPMRASLAAFEADAARLAAHIDHALAALEASGISAQLSSRLESACAARGEAERIRRELATANEQVSAATSSLDEARASLRPLYELAGVDTPEMLAARIARSQRKRELTTAVNEARDAFIKGGDGLPLDALIAEVDGADIAGVQAELSLTSSALNESVNVSTALAAQLDAAKRELDAISGEANAARAEARRQEALAAMADAAERFVKVETASTLLKWAIDRYRERRQGPMLSRASAIFSELTLGAFSRLVVDYDRQPMALAAVRATSGAHVEIEGMSEGTRDQLFLALRLAALEEHGEKASALPFVADDLFINFDDGRARAGLRVLAQIAKRTQVIFLSHHDHLVGMVREVFGPQVNVRYMG